MTRFYRRRFLNKRGHHAGAYVLAEVLLERDTDTDVADSRGPWLAASLTVSDCARIARLDFAVYELPDASNALHKARQLREVVVGFTAALEEAVEELRALSSN